MKLQFQKFMMGACNLCLALAGILHWKGTSLLLFGEEEFPSDAQK